jgi:hypothetical protein
MSIGRQKFDFEVHARGYTIEDSSGYMDPSLCDDVWPTVPRPAVVLQVWKDWRGKSKVAPIIIGVER